MYVPYRVLRVYAPQPWVPAVRCLGLCSYWTNDFRAKWLITNSSPMHSYQNMPGSGEGGHKLVHIESLLSCCDPLKKKTRKRKLYQVDWYLSWGPLNRPVFVHVRPSHDPSTPKVIISRFIAILEPRSRLPSPFRPWWIGRQFTMGAWVEWCIWCRSSWTWRPL